MISRCKDTGIAFDGMASGSFQTFREWADEHAVVGLTSERQPAKEIAQSRNLIISAKDVQDYICIFSILVYIEGEGISALHYLGEIMRRGYDDASLPWNENRNGRHEIFGDTIDGTLLLKVFIDTQWMFYPMPSQPFLNAHPTMPSRVFMPNGRAKPIHNRLVHAKQIFPITEDLDRPTDTTRATRRVTVSYMKIHSTPSSQQSLTTPSIVVFKTYPPAEERIYKDECDAYAAIRDARNDGNLLQCLGSFQYITERGEQFSTIISELADSGTLRDLFSSNSVPYRVEHVHTLWESFSGVLNGLTTMHNQIFPHGYLCFHQDLKPSNLFLFESKDDNRPFSYAMKIGDFGSSYCRSANPALHTQNIPDKGATRIYGPPETFLGDTFHFKPESSADMWAIGCIMIEMAVWITGGKIALDEFRRERMAETKVLAQHERLGRSDCFHDGSNVLNSVRGVVHTVNENRRQHDVITPAMVDLALNCVLIGKNERLHANQFIPMLRRILLEGPGSKSSIEDSIPEEQTTCPVPQTAHCNLYSLLQHEQHFSDMDPWSSGNYTLVQSPASEMFTSSSTLLPSPPPELSDNSQIKISTTEIPLDPRLSPVVQTEMPRESSEATTKSNFQFMFINELQEWISDCDNQNTELRCRNEAKSRLEGRGFIFLIDDSNYTKDYEEIKKWILSIAYLIDPDTIDVANTSPPQVGSRIQTRRDMSKFFKQIFTRKLVVDCMMEKGLNKVLDPIKAKWSRHRNESIIARRNLLFVPGMGQRLRNTQDVMVLLFPTGEWEATPEGICGAEKPILRSIESVCKHGISGTQISTKFVRLGLEKCGTQQWKGLDSKYQKTFDVVDMKPYGS